MTGRRTHSAQTPSQPGRPVRQVRLSLQKLRPSDFEDVFRSLNKNEDVVLGLEGDTGDNQQPENRYSALGSVTSPEPATTLDARNQTINWRISYTCLKNVYESCMEKWNSDRQCFKSFSSLFAKVVYTTFIRDLDVTDSDGPSYFTKLVDPKHAALLEKDLSLRKAISVFTVTTFPDSNPKEIGIVLSDVGKQKRKNEKQKLERKKDLHRCKKCNLVKKNATERMKHERVCHKNFVEPKRKKRAAAVKANQFLNNVSKEKLPQAGPCQVFDSNPKRSPKYEKEREMVIKKTFPGLSVEQSVMKRGCLVAKKIFAKMDMICEYQGILITGAENIKAQHELYNETDHGSYMFEYKFKGIDFCVDATPDVGWGRYSNHSKKGNAKIGIFEYEENNQDKHVVVLRARKEIAIGSQIEWDYGEWDKKTLKAFPWLTK